MRKTKIVCTIGPASTDEKIITDMCKAGMNVARLNFSHGTHEEQQKKIDIIKKVRTKLNLPIAVMLDTKGPEYRIRTFKDGKIELKAGAPFTFTTDEVEGDQTIVSVSYKNLNKDLNVGDRILLNNGLMEFVVKEIKGNNIITEVTVGGVLSDRKSMSFPNKVLKQKYLSEQDKQDILFGIKNEIFRRFLQMSKLSKIFFIIGILIISSISFAATADMNLSSSTSSQSTSTSSSSTKATNTTPTKSTQYSTTVSASNFDLQLTNILSICLIVVGVLLILLAIAILIRLKN